MAVYGDQAAHDPATAAAAEARAAAFAQAYENFAALDAPALTLDETAYANANAEERQGNRILN